MNMNKLFLILGGFVGAVVLLVVGIALGDVLSDDTEASASPGGSEIADDTDPDDSSGPRQIATATPVAGPELSAEPSSTPAVETTDPTWPAPSPFQVVDPPTGDADDDDADVAEVLASLYDPETGIDSDATGEPWVPPTSPSFDPESGEVDPEAPAERTEGVDDVPADEAEDLFVPYLGLDLPFRFVDDCAGEPGSDGGEDCPEGVGGTIQLTGAGDPPEPLSIMRQLYTKLNVPVTLRCDAPLGTDSSGVHRAVFGSNNPATFTIRYFPSTARDDVREVTYTTPESEVDLWIERRLAGESTASSNLRSSVHNCPELPGLYPGRHTTFEVHGVDDAGSEVDATIYYTPPTEVAGNVSVGRPHATFVPLDTYSGRGVVTVPYNERTEQVYVASLPRAGERATTESCTDVENAVLAGTRRLDGSLYNWETTSFPRTDGDGYEPGIESSVVTHFAGEEGTTYDLCVWVTKPPTKSFDKPPVVQREVFTVRPPRRWRVRLLVGGGHTDTALEAGALRIRPANWPNPTAATWPTEDLPSGVFMLDGMQVLRDGGSSPVPSITSLELTGPTGTTTEVNIPTPTNCTFPFPCSRGGVEQYDIAIPGRTTRHVMCGGGPCDQPTDAEVIGNLRLVVETYAGPGGAPTGGLDGADGWQIDHEARFAAAGPEAPPPTPRIDHNSVLLEAVGGTGGILGGRPGLHVRVAFDRPVQVTVQPQVVLGGPCPVPVAPQSTDGLTQIIDMTFEDMCWGSTYSVDVLATDAAGNVLDARTLLDGAPTGRTPWRIVDMPEVPITEYTATVTVNQIGEGYGASHLRVGPVEVVPHGSGIRCVAGTEPTVVTVRNSGGRPITVGDPWSWPLEVNQRGNGEDCGERGHGEWMRLDTAVPLDQLLAGPVTLHYTHEDGTDVSVVIDDVVWG